jgi:hypothetical protein
VEDSLYLRAEMHADSEARWDGPPTANYSKPELPPSAPYFGLVRVRTAQDIDVRMVNAS